MQLPRSSQFVASWLRRGVLAAMVCSAASAVAAPPSLPPLNDPPTSEHHTGKVVMLQLATPDIEASKRFYGGLFHWTFRDFGGGKTPYVQASLNGSPVAGLRQKDLQKNANRTPAWLGYFSVPDADVAAKSATEHGAKILFEPHLLPDRGRQAVLADPQGAVFGVLASSSGDAADELADPGEWIWSSLITSDVDASGGFYQTLFNYEVFEMDDDNDGNADHVLFSSENYARASANPLPANKPDVRSHWIHFVRVEDAQAATRKAVELGGRIVVEPRPDRHGGKIAVITDPQGVHVGLMEWSDTESKEVKP
jgi:uncharacterized protein